VHFLVECSELVIDIAWNEQHNKRVTLHHWCLMNMTDNAEFKKWTWNTAVVTYFKRVSSICLEGFQNNKTPYRTASDINAEVPGSNFCHGSDCSQVLCGIRHFMKCSDVRWNGAVGNLNRVRPNERVVKCSWVKFKWEEVKFSEWSVVKVILTWCLTLLEDI
jgi:hypothetical protein